MIWVKALKLNTADGTKVFAEGFCESSETKPVTVKENRVSLAEYPLATGSNLIESDTGDWYFYNETDGDWTKMLTIKEE